MAEKKGPPEIISKPISYPTSLSLGRDLELSARWGRMTGPRKPGTRESPAGPDHLPCAGHARIGPPSSCTGGGPGRVVVAGEDTAPPHVCAPRG